MKISKTLPQQQFRFMVGRLDDLKPLNVTVVQAEPSQLQADAYITASSESCYEGAKKMRRDLSGAMIIDQDHRFEGEFVAISRSADNRYHGIYAVELKTEQYDRGVPFRYVQDVIALVQTLRVAAGMFGATSAVVDCDGCFRVEADEFGNFQDDTRISSIIGGVQSYVSYVNNSRTSSLVGDIALAMGADMYAVWEKNSEMFLGHLQVVEI